MATPKTAQPRMPLADVMAALEAAGTEQARKIYRRHGAREPVFGVQFAVLKTLYKRIGVDHELAMALWQTGNFDARNLAVKVVNPALMTFEDLDAWGKDSSVAMVMAYVAHVAVESPHAQALVASWLAAASVDLRAAGWSLVAAMSQRDVQTPDSWFVQRLTEIEAQIRTAPNAVRGPMNHALITIGCRNDALRPVATATAQRIGPVEIDHGDTACETVEAAPRIDKTWAHSLSKGFASPAAHERARESMRTRC